MKPAEEGHRRRGVVWIGEEVDPRDAGRMTARFSAHWEAEENRRSEDGPRNVPLDDAIRWGRKRARVVLIQFGSRDEAYSAGDEEPDGSGLWKRWPEGGSVVRPRPFGAPLDGRQQTAPFRLSLRLEDVGATRGRAAQLAERAERLGLLRDVTRVDAGDRHVTLEGTVVAEGVTAGVVTLNDELSQELRAMGGASDDVLIAPGLASFDA